MFQTGHRILPLAMAIFVVAGLCACQSTPINDFAKVKEGMEKDVVLETAGSPTITRRWHGKDRWIYEFKTRNAQDTQIREVHFAEGKAVYVGTRVVADVPAEEQDRLNEEANAAETQRVDKDYDTWASSVGLIKPSPGPVILDEYDKKLRESIYGVSDSSEKPKPPPHFDAIQ